MHSLLLAACGSQEPQNHSSLATRPSRRRRTASPSVPTLHAGDVTMEVTNYGARVVSLWTPRPWATTKNIVLGYETIDRHINNDGERFLGAVVGTLRQPHRQGQLHARRHGVQPADQQ